MAKIIPQNFRFGYMGVFHLDHLYEIKKYERKMGLMTLRIGF
jgi:hypothetical protein